MPVWFINNNWHQTIYVSYAGGDTPPGGPTQTCIPGTDCLTLLNYPIPNDDIRALVISAGQDLTPATARPNGNIADYFENENVQPVPSSNTDLTFERNAYPQDLNVFNDQVRIVAP